MDTRAPSFPDSAGEPSVADGCRTHAERAPAADATLLLPGTNRGVIVANENIDEVQVGIHWVSLTAFTNPSNLVQCVMEAFLRQPLADIGYWDKVFIDSGKSGRRYKSLFFGPLGLRLYAYPGMELHCHLEIPGEAIEQMGQAAILELLSSLNELTHCDRVVSGDEPPEPRPVVWRCTRLDIAFDHVPFSPRQCYDAWQRGDVRCAANRDSYKWIESETGNTLYIGSRMSGRFVRIYDRRGFTRLEFELKGHWADGIGAVVAAAPYETWRDFALSHLRQFLDFVNRDTGGSVSRADLLPWWAVFAERVERATERFDRGDAGIGCASAD